MKSTTQSLGTYGEYCGQTADDLREEMRRLFPQALKYLLQSAARKLAPEHRVAKCHRKPAYLASSIDVKKTSEGKAFFTGLQSCNSVWDDAVCAAKIAERRAFELHGAATKHLESGGSLLLATFTLRHKKADPLIDVLRTVRESHRAMKSRRDYKTARASGITHDVTTLEVTAGSNGWHPHLHALIFSPYPPTKLKNKKLLTDEQSQLRRDIGGAWQTAVRLAGGDMLPEVGFKLQGGDYATDYVAKWGIVREISNAVNKKGRLGGRTPLELLWHYAVIGDESAGELWQEYSRAFFGRNQLTWSHGAKAYFGIDEISDAAAAAAESSGEIWAAIDLLTWRCVVMAATDLRAALLKACETDDRDHFTDLLAQAVEQDMERNSDKLHTKGAV